MKRYKHNILVVDDEPHNLESLRRTFRREYNVFVAAGGEEGLAIVQQETIALIITDQRMPGLSGIQLLERAMAVYPHAIRIILTAFTDVDALIGAIHTGRVYRYITKPWDPEELKVTVKRAIELYELTMENERLVGELSKKDSGPHAPQEGVATEAMARLSAQVSPIAKEMRASVAEITRLTPVFERALTAEEPSGADVLRVMVQETERLAKMPDRLLDLFHSA
ncbi:MAG: response regulator [Candidatus Latescibacterota bacterium]